ncbi:MAG: hypothetical protein OEM82_13800, partial [Acidobacteriota bacterium]|nr:hypothetical protein [Acidobacteriota bacterium]
QGSGSVCPETYTDVYADMLKAAKSSRGNIVFYQPTRRAYQNARKELLKELVDLGIERKRLRTFWVKGSFPGDEGTELWFLP